VLVGYALNPGLSYIDYDNKFENIQTGECYALMGKLVNPSFKNIDMRGWGKRRSAVVAVKLLDAYPFGNLILINGTFEDIVLD